MWAIAEDKVSKGYASCDQPEDARQDAIECQLQYCISLANKVGRKAVSISSSYLIRSCHCLPEHMLLSPLSLQSKG